MPPLPKNRDDQEINDLKETIGKLTDAVNALNIQLTEHNTEQKTFLRDMSTHTATLARHETDINALGEMTRNNSASIKKIEETTGKIAWYILAPILGALGLAIILIVAEYLKNVL